MGGKGTVGHLFVLGVSKVRTTLIGEEFELMVGRDRVRRNNNNNNNNNNIYFHADTI
jgi:hypothetical protein